MRSTLDLISSRAVPPLAFLGDGFGILEVVVALIVVVTGGFLCVVAYDLNTDFRRMAKRDAKHAAKVAAGDARPKRVPQRRPAPQSPKVPADKAIR
jgi:hypothetical protein